MSRLVGGVPLVALAALALVGCEGQPTGYSGKISTTRFFTAVHAIVPAAAGGAARVIPGVDKRGLALSVAAAGEAPLQLNGVLITGPYPQLVNGPVATVDLESSVIAGLPAKLRVSSSAPFTHVAVTVGGAEDYWEIILPSPVLEVQVVATAASSMPNSDFPLEVAVGTPAGYGTGGQEPVNAIDLLSADIGVVLRWNANSDVDLHVWDAKGNEIYFADPQSEEGGRLDLDSNPACNIDGVNQEVISWPLGRAPLGEYRVEVHYWSDCGVPRSDYNVTMMVRGRTVETANGFFEGPSSQSSRREVGRFSLP